MTYCHNLLSLRIVAILETVKNENIFQLAKTIC